MSGEHQTSLMNCRRTLFLELVLVVSAFAGAEQPTVRQNTQIPVELISETSSATAKQGQALTFVTTEAVLIGHNIVIPRGAKVLGQMESVQSGLATSRSVLQISIRRIEWDGGSAALNAVVLGVESSDTDVNPVWRHFHRAVAGRPTMLNNIAIRSHVGRQASVEFESDRGDFVLRPGVRLLLWQIDPEQDPVMFARNPILEVRSTSK
jgi:hypothetical protein